MEVLKPNRRLLAGAIDGGFRFTGAAPPC